MSRIDYEKLLIQPGAAKTACQVFIFDLPEENEEVSPLVRRSDRKVFGIIEVELPPSRKVSAFINALAQEIGNFKMDGAGKPDETIFEKLVQKINYKYLDLIGNKSVFGDEDSPIPRINAILTLASEKNILLASRGRIFPFLVYQARPQFYKIINISESASGKEGRGSINLFTNIISGKMNVGDYLMLSTESLLDYFSLEKICRMVSEHAPDEASKNFSALLSETANQRMSFAAIILNLKPEKKSAQIHVAEAKPAQTITPQGSLDNLLKTANNTGKMLTPSLRLNIGSGLSSFFQKIKSSRSEKKQLKDKAKLEYYSSQFAPPSRLGKLFKPVAWLFMAIFRSIYLVLKTIIVSMYKLFRAPFGLFGGKKISAEKTESSSPQAAETNAPAERKKSALPRFSKALLVSAAVIVCLFLAGTAFLYFKYEKEAAAESLKQKVTAIKDKKNAAEASLIYNDETGAGKLLAEADTLLAAFPQNTPEEKSSYENVAAELEALRSKLRHSVNIENPESVVNFSEHNPGASVNEFMISGNKLYAFDNLASAVYEMNLETKEMVNKNAPGLSLRYGFPESDISAIFYQPEKQFFSFDFSEDILKEHNVALGEAEKTVDDIAVYNGRLYVLDSSDNQIFKHGPAELGYTIGIPWIKDGTDIKKAVSFAIDGSVYVTTSDGNIIKMENGQKTDFPFMVDPALSSPGKMWTSVDSSYLYILEPAGKRLVVFDKAGKLKAQYVSDMFSDLHDFFVAEKDKKIYFLSGNQVFVVPATHL